MDYNVIYKNHNLGIPPVFPSIKLKTKYFKWMKKQGLKIPSISAQTYIKRILKELNFRIPQVITFEQKFENPLITSAIWLYGNTTLAMKEISEIMGISTMTIENNLKVKS